VAGVRRALEQVKRLHDNIESIAEESVGQASPSFVEAQKDQLFQGSNSTGGSFRRYKNPDYAKEKNLMNPLPGLGNPDLKLNGDLYAAIYVTVQNGVLTVGSKDQKAQMLEASYKNIFGLNPQEMEDFLYGKVRPIYHQNIINSLKQ
jgi:hypothetical protein